MKNKAKLLQCALGFHEYTIPTPDSFGRNIKLCKNCKRYGYYKDSSGYEIWTEYNDKGREVYYRSSDGYEIWFDGKKWVREKPKDWVYER